jgi:hypothetical protein
MPSTVILSSEVAVVVGGRGGASSSKDGRATFESSEAERERCPSAAATSIIIGLVQWSSTKASNAISKNKQTRSGTPQHLEITVSVCSLARSYGRSAAVRMLKHGG